MLKIKEEDRDPKTIVDIGDELGHVDNTESEVGPEAQEDLIGEEVGEEDDELFSFNDSWEQ